MIVRLPDFGYDISVSLEDIKSPLPPRRILLETEEVTAEPETIVNNEMPIDNNTQPIEGQPVIATAKKNKKTLILIIIGAVVVVVLAILLVFFLKNRNKTETVTLNYWGLWEDESVMNGVIADFEAKNPNIKINYKRNELNGYEGRLSGRLAKDVSEGDVPDIFRIHNTWIPMFRNNLTPVPKETATALGLDSDFFDVYKNDLKENGSYLSIPLMYDGLAMFYNTDLLDKAQVQVPTNWWDLEKSAEKITQRDSNGKITVAGAALGLVDNVDHWGDIVGLMMKQNGVDFTSTSDVNQKKINDVLDFYTLFKTDGKVWDETLPNSTQYFANGNLGFYFGPSWRIFDIQALNPNLKFAVASVPQLPTLESTSTNQVDATANLTNINWASYWTEGVNSKSKYQKEAWKFLEYLASSEGLEKMYQASSQNRSFGEIYPRKSMVAKISDNTQLKPFVDTANTATSWYLASSTEDNAVDTQMQKYFADAINTKLTGTDSNDSAVKTLQSGISQLQKLYKLTK
jgi:multiple sugar transport system substrate-binding protein